MRRLISNQRGFSLMEILTVVIMIGILSALALPRFGNTLAHQDVRGARSAITTKHARARAAAISRGRSVAFAIRDGALAIRTRHPVSGATENIGDVDDIRDRFGVTISIDPTSRDTLFFDPRGLGRESETTTIIVSKRGYADTITIAPRGRILH